MSGKASKAKRRSVPADARAPGWRIRDDVKDVFTQWCDSMGHSYEVEAEGAVFVWRFFPPDIREWAKRAINGEAEFDAAFWRGFSAAFDEAVQNLKASLREHAPPDRSEE